MNKNKKYYFNITAYDTRGYETGSSLDNESKDFENEEEARAHFQKEVKYFENLKKNVFFTYVENDVASILLELENDEETILLKEIEIK